MAEKMIFAGSPLDGTGKEGIIKPLDDGSYPIILGAFNASNFGGIKYLFQGAKQCLEKNSTMLRKWKKNQLFGELGHPTPYGLSKSEFTSRWSTIVDKEAVWQINRWEFSGEVTKNFKDEDVILIHGFVTPWGIGSDCIRESFANPNMNTAASIRCVANQGMVGGIIVRNPVDIITFDAVLEQGMPQANKYATPACESFGGIPDASFDGMEYRREFVEAYEHQLAIRSEFAGESIDIATNHIDIVKVAGGWYKTDRLDMPGLQW